MDPLDVTHGVLQIAGRLEFGAGLVREHQHAPGVRHVSVPPIQACCQHAWCLASVEPLPPREGRTPWIGAISIVPTHAMAKRLPLCHRDVLRCRQLSTCGLQYLVCQECCASCDWQCLIGM